MPTQARWFVKAGLAYLVLSFVAGVVLLTLEALDRPAPYVFGVEHAHLGMVRWLVNVVIGIALWMLPCNRERFPRTQALPRILASVTSRAACPWHLSLHRRYFCYVDRHSWNIVQSQ